MFGQVDKKTIVIFLCMVTALVVFLFYSLSGGEPDSGEITMLQTSPLDEKLGRELLSALAKLRTTKLDISLFDDPVFNSLKDFGVEIASEPIGRRNPFASFEEKADAKAGTKAGTKAGSSSAVKTPSSLPKTSAPAPKPPVLNGFDVE